VGRSQGAVIFWGLVSAFFATGFCYYLRENYLNETSANKYRDQVLTLQEQCDTLSSQKDKLQSSISETENELKTREEFLQDKESKLADEETRLEALGQQSLNQTQQSQSQATTVKKFNDTVRKLVNDHDTDVVVRGGRPVLRVPDSVFFAFGEATIKPEGKALLTQITQALNGQMDNFELRVETFTDSDGETAKAGDDSPTAKKDTAAKPEDAAKPETAGKTPPAKTHYASDWDLTGARAGALARFLREGTSLPFQNVVVVPRADFQPIVSSGKEGHARNRRVEITVEPLPPAFHAADTTKTSTAAASPHAPDKTDAAAKAKTEN
jgi:flagellar motor protein MotB